MKTPTKVWARVPHDRSGRAAYPHAAAPWPKVRMGEIADFIQTGPFGSQLHQHDYSENGTPVVMPKDLICGCISETTIARVSEEHVGRLSRHKVKPGDFLFSRRGDVGRCALVREKESGWLCGTGCLRVGIKHELADSQFLLYSFSQHDIVAWLEGHAVGATMPNINPAILSNLPFPLPPLPIQRRIASVLGAYDDLIENNRRRIALLEKMARELYRERFVRRAGKGNTVTLGEIMSITRGLSYTSKEIDTEDGVNLINLKNIRSFGGFREEGTKKYSGDYKNAQVVKKGDLVMGVTDMTQERRTVGAVALLPDLEGESVLSADLIKIDSDFGNCFLFCMFCYGGVSSQIGQFATGATVLHLRPQAVLDFSVTLPPREEVEEFESQIFPLFEEQGNLLSQNRSLSRQRDKLLPRLMSGKINVEDLAKEEK